MRSYIFFTARGCTPYFVAASVKEFEALKYTYIYDVTSYRLTVRYPKWGRVPVQIETTNYV